MLVHQYKENTGFMRLDRIADDLLVQLNAAASAWGSLDDRTLKLAKALVALGAAKGEIAKHG